MSMALLYRSSSPYGAQWRSELCRLVPDLDFRVHPEIGRREDIDIMLAWSPPHGLLASLPNLRLIISLGAGIDHLLGDETLPRHIPVMRLVDPDMIRQMSEYLVMQVLRLHRDDLTYAAQQRAAVWQEHRQTRPASRRIGILGLGQYGADAARKLAALGFDVAGWSRSPKTLDGIAAFHGPDGFAALLARSDILICLLPLTSATAGILDRRAFAQLPEGAMVINVGRGQHLVEDDLLAALDAGTLGGAVLDVFQQEPLPGDHPIWRHPRIVVTPHIAASTHPLTGAPIVADAILRLRAGRELKDLVDLEREY
jgi:glyoxylate/hydroxypyruvate reductase A